MKPPRTIPEIRDRLHELADEHPDPEVAQELHALAEETRRRPPTRRSPPKARGVTKDVAQAVRFYALRHPREPYRDVGRRFGIDGGRVSEIVHGKRGEA